MPALRRQRRWQRCAANDSGAPVTAAIPTLSGQRRWQLCAASDSGAVETTATAPCWHRSRARGN
eukprot:4917497-Pleurochrysis_carterae.AAC.1